MAKRASFDTDAVRAAIGVLNDNYDAVRAKFDSYAKMASDLDNEANHSMADIKAFAENAATMMECLNKFKSELDEATNEFNRQMKRVEDFAQGEV